MARRGKVRYFSDWLRPGDVVLDVGCADNWLKRELAPGGHTVIGVDLYPPADLVGDIFRWSELGLVRHSVDVIMAFEVLEHGDFARPFAELLKPGGLLLATTPVPALDPVCRALERVRLLQKRTSPHSHLTDLRAIDGFEVVERRIRAGVSQWGVLRSTAVRP